MSRGFDSSSSSSKFFQFGLGQHSPADHSGPNGYASDAYRISTGELAIPPAAASSNAADAVAEALEALTPDSRADLWAAAAALAAADLEARPRSLTDDLTLPIESGTYRPMALPHHSNDSHLLTRTEQHLYETPGLAQSNATVELLLQAVENAQRNSHTNSHVSNPWFGTLPGSLNASMGTAPYRQPSPTLDFADLLGTNESCGPRNSSFAQPLPNSRLTQSAPWPAPRVSETREREILDALLNATHAFGGVHLDGRMPLSAGSTHHRLPDVESTASMLSMTKGSNSESPDDSTLLLSPSRRTSRHCDSSRRSGASASAMDSNKASEAVVTAVAACVRALLAATSEQHPTTGAAPAGTAVAEARRAPAKGWWKTQPCRFWRDGPGNQCRNGATCRWAHGNAEMQALAAEKAADEETAYVPEPTDALANQPPLTSPFMLVAAVAARMQQQGSNLADMMIWFGTAGDLEALLSDHSGFCRLWHTLGGRRFTAVGDEARFRCQLDRIITTSPWTSFSMVASTSGPSDAFCCTCNRPVACKPASSEEFSRAGLVCQMCCRTTMGVLQDDTRLSRYWRPEAWSSVVHQAVAAHETQENWILAASSYLQALEKSFADAPGTLTESLHNQCSFNRLAFGIYILSNQLPTTERMLFMTATWHNNMAHSAEPPQAPAVTTSELVQNGFLATAAKEGNLALFCALLRNAYPVPRLAWMAAKLTPPLSSAQSMSAAATVGSGCVTPSTVASAPLHGSTEPSQCLYASPSATGEALTPQETPTTPTTREDRKTELTHLWPELSLTGD